jgi:regulator of cell morphogenesis and NO signaling
MNYAAKTVAEVAVEVPQSVKVFQTVGIDYCCGGQKPLTEACGRVGMTLDEVVSLIEREMAGAAERGQARDWAGASITELMAHILETHHVFTREAIARLVPLSRKVSGKHGERRPELLSVHATFMHLCEELISHMMKEEQILFPYAGAIDEALSSGRPLPSSPFGSVQNPIRMMMMEHDAAGELLAKLRELTAGYELPEDACMSYQAYFSGMEELERDLHQHIHLENNILFPKAVEMEEKAATAVAY